MRITIFRFLLMFVLGCLLMEDLVACFGTNPTGWNWCVEEKQKEDAKEDTSEKDDKTLKQKDTDNIFADSAPWLLNNHLSKSQGFVYPTAFFPVVYLAVFTPPPEFSCC